MHYKQDSCLLFIFTIDTLHLHLKCCSLPDYFDFLYILTYVHTYLFHGLEWNIRVAEAAYSRYGVADGCMAASEAVKVVCMQLMSQFLHCAKPFFSLLHLTDRPVIYYCICSRLIMMVSSCLDVFLSQQSCIIRSRTCHNGK